MADRTNLRPIVPNRDEKARQRLLGVFARRASGVLTARNIPHAPKGGTALQTRLRTAAS